MAAGEPYQKECRRGCGTLVTIGPDNNGNWKPYDNYEANVLHKCPKYVPQQQQQRWQQQQPASQPRDSGTIANDRIIEIAHEISVVKERLKKLDIIEWQIEKLAKQIGIHSEDAGHDPSEVAEVEEE